MSARAVEDILMSAAKLCSERNTLYGDTHTDIGKFIDVMFPKGVTIKGPEDWNRLFTLIQCANKLLRYSSRMAKGGHQDSARDLCVYAAMLEAMTNEETHPILAPTGHGTRVGETPAVT